MRGWSCARIQDQGVDGMNGDVESGFVREMENVDGVDRTGRVSRPVRDGGVSSSAVGRERDGTLRLSRTYVRPRCCDNGDVEVTPGAPVPASVPGEFVVVMGAVLSGATLRGLEEGMAGPCGPAGLLSVLEWVEVEVEGFDDGLVEGLHLIRGAVMSVAAAVAGEL